MGDQENSLMPSTDQWFRLIDIVQDDAEMRENQFLEGPNGVTRLGKKWNDAADIVNILGPAKKCGEKWKKALCKLKSRAKSAANDKMAYMRRRTGGGPPPELEGLELNPVYTKALTLIPKVSILGNQNVPTPLEANQRMRGQNLEGQSFASRQSIGRHSLGQSCAGQNDNGDYRRFTSPKAHSPVFSTGQGQNTFSPNALHGTRRGHLSPREKVGWRSPPRTNFSRPSNERPPLGRWRRSPRTPVVNLVDLVMETPPDNAPFKRAAPGSDRDFSQGSTRKRLRFDNASPTSPHLSRNLAKESSRAAPGNDRDFSQGSTRKRLRFDNASPTFPHLSRNLAKETSQGLIQTNEAYRVGTSALGLSELQESVDRLTATMASVTDIFENLKEAVENNTAAVTTLKESIVQQLERTCCLTII